MSALTLYSLRTELPKRLEANGIKSKTLGAAQTHLNIEANKKSYLIIEPRGSGELTPGRIKKYVNRFPKLRGRKIDGHVILDPNYDLSHLAIVNDGQGLPPKVATVGLWQGANRLITSSTDREMEAILRAVGIPDSHIMAVKRRSRRNQQLSRTSQAVAEPVTPTTQDGGTFWKASPQRGQSIDKYELQQRLGRGMSAEVWKATTTHEIPGVRLTKGSTVALKVYSPAFLNGMQPLRIHREFSIASEITHENFARVYDLLLSPSRPFHSFLAMEFVDGPSLKDHISQQGSLEWKVVVRIGIQLFSALAELHSHMAIHRDVKAANIMVAGNIDGIPSIKLVDLGIVDVAAEQNFTAGSVFLGSKHSAPLEQLTGKEITVRADIYAAGSVLFHCLNGRPMYDGAGPEGAIVSQMLTRPQRTSDMKSNWSGSTPQLMSFLDSCIEVEEKNRPASAENCVRVLTSIAQMAPAY